MVLFQTDGQTCSSKEGVGVQGVMDCAWPTTHRNARLAKLASLSTGGGCITVNITQTALSPCFECELRYASAFDADSSATKLALANMRSVSVSCYNRASEQGSVGHKQG
jgi:hypothetical protein